MLVDECNILRQLDGAEERVHEAAWRFYFRSARHDELRAARRETIHKLAEVERQLVRFENEALPQATFSVWGTEMTLLERRHITKALEPQEFKDGAVLIKQGEPRDAFFIIVQGKVSCTRDHRCKVAPPACRPFGAPQRASASAPRQSPGKAPACQGPGAPPGKAVHRGARPRAPPRAPGASRLRAQHLRSQAPISRSFL